MARRRSSVGTEECQLDLFEAPDDGSHETEPIEREVVFIVWSEEADSVVFAAAKRLVGKIWGVHLSVLPFTTESEAREIITRTSRTRDRRVFLLIDFERRQHERQAELAKLSKMQDSFAVVVFSRESNWAEKARGLKRIIDRVTRSIASVPKASGARAFFAARETLRRLATIGME